MGGGAYEQLIGERTKLQIAAVAFFRKTKIFDSYIGYGAPSALLMLTKGLH